MDGYLNFNFMDDANMPSLLSLPLLKFLEKDNIVYQNTRKFLLSDKNPYYYQGNFTKGIGSIHNDGNYVWPISLLAQIMTSNDD